MRTLSLGERFWRRYARGVVALRHVIVVGWAVGAVAAVVFLPGLGSSGGSPLGDIVPAKSAALAAQQHAFKLFGSAVATDTIVVERNPRGLTDPELRAVGDTALAARQRRLPRPLAGIRAAVPLVNLKGAGTPWREERTTAATFLFLDDALSLQRHQDAAEGYARLLRPARGTVVGATGAGPARLAQFGEIEDVLPTVELATVAIILLVVALFFRSVGAPLVTLVTAAAAYFVAVRVLAWGGEQVGASVPQEIEPLLVVLLLGLVTDYTIFFLSEGRRRLLRGESRLEAARRSTARIAPIVFTAGVLVAGGTIALLAGKLAFFQAFGPGLAVSALLVTLVCVTLLPALLALLGPWLFGRRVREVEAAAPEAPAAAAAPEGGHVRLEPARGRRWRERTAGPRGAVRASKRLAAQEGRRTLPFLVQRLLAWRPVAGVMVVLCVGLMGLAALQIPKADLGVAFVASLPRDSTPRVAGDAAARGFVPGILAPVDVVLERPGLAGDPRALEALQRDVARQPGVATVIGPHEAAGTPLASATVTRDGGAARLLVVLADDPTSAAGIATYRHLRDAMPRLLEQAGAPGTRVSYGGETPLADETIHAVLHDLWRISAAVLVIGYVLLAIFLGSLVAPLLLLFGSALAVAASLGITALLMPDVLGGTQLTYYIPLVAGVLLVSLGSDYNVFIAGSIRDEARRRRLSEAVAVATPAASKPMTVAGITLAATFAVLALVPLRPFRELAMLLALGVLLDALFLRRLLIPALISVVGRATWWPGQVAQPPGGRRFLERVAAHAGSSVEDARLMTTATLCTLGERLPPAQAAELAAHLPEELRAPLTARGEAESFGYTEFLVRVAEREAVSVPTARCDVGAVMATVADVLPQSELDYVRASLTADYTPLLDGALAARPEPAGAPA